MLIDSDLENVVCCSLKAEQILNGDKYNKIAREKATDSQKDKTFVYC